MTPDSTQSDATRSETVDEKTEMLAGLIAPVRFVLFDFDGPICHLFAGQPAKRVAQDLVEWLARRGLRDLLTDKERAEPDPYIVMRAVDRRHPGSDLIDELEQWLTRKELDAVRTAFPTAHVDPLIRTWTAVGARLAVTTNNAPGPVERYLATRGLQECFARHIYGRTRDLGLLKPDPHCLNRALRALGADPQRTLMIGDTPSDCEAARRAGVGFLGYARDEHKAEVLRKAGAKHLVGSLEPVRRAVRKAGINKAR